jgi:hypothetical protein
LFHGLTPPIRLERCPHFYVRKLLGSNVSAGLFHGNTRITNANRLDVVASM